MKRYVIIGNCVAAVGCIEGIRSVDKDGEITVISAERKPAYCRPLISYYLEGKTDIKNMSYRPKDFYKKNNVKVVYDTATKIDSKEKKVSTNKSGDFEYDSVCIATGSAPFVPKFEGLDTVKNKFTFMTVSDTLALEKAINENSKVFIIGAGLIGLKCAEGLAKRIKKVTVCDMADRVLSSILDADSAKVMQSCLEENGLEFLLGDSVKHFNKNTAVMNSGKTVDFDVLVLAVGVRAKIDTAVSAGCKTNRGILTDKKMQTSVKSVYAAGDCAEGYDMLHGENHIIAIMPNAYIQGFTAGKNMAGEKAVFENAVAMNSIGFFGLHAMTAGIYEGEVYDESDENTVKKLFVKDGCLVGFILIGQTERAGIYTFLIREKIPLSSVNFEVLKKVASTFAFSETERRKKFGGAV